MKSDKRKIIFFGAAGLVMILAAALVFFSSPFAPVKPPIFSLNLAFKKMSSLKIDTIEDVKGLGYTGQRKTVLDKNGNALIVYRKKLQGNYEVFFSKAASGSSGWQIIQNPAPVSAVDNGANQRVPSIAVSPDGTIHVVWYGADSGSSNQVNNRQVKYVRSIDGGKTWSHWKNIAYVNGYSGQDYWQEHPSILASSDGTLYVVWEGKDKTNPNNQQIKFIRSTDGGETWTAWKNVEVTGSKTQSRPTLAEGAGGRIYLFMYSSMGNGNGLQQIQFVSSGDQGNSWSKWQTISNPAYDSRHISAAADPAGNIYVAWREQNGSDSSRIVFRSFINNKWSAIIPVASSRAGYQFFPTLGVGSQGKVAVAWMETPDSSSLPNEDPSSGKIYLATYNGNVFSSSRFIGKGLYPNLPVSFSTASGLPLLYESNTDSSGNYAVILDSIPIAS